MAGIMEIVAVSKGLDSGSLWDLLKNVGRLWAFLRPRDVLALAQTCTQANAVVGGATDYWWRQCTTVTNMRGQKAKPWIDYRHMYLAARWRRIRSRMWTAADQKHWSRLYQRKRVFDHMEAAVGSGHELELLRDVVKQEADAVLSGQRPQLLQQVARAVCSSQCDCRKKPRRGLGRSLCPRHDKDAVRTALQTHMAAWLQDTRQIGTDKDVMQITKIFEDRVRTLVRTMAYTDSGLLFKLDSGVIEFDKGVLE